MNSSKRSEATSATSGALLNEILAAATRRLETARLPISTYRVQLNWHCRFRDVEAAVAYLNRLGISDLYASPFLQALPGSMHGYDVVDPSAVNTEIGTRAELASLRHALSEHAMGLIADVVPNHMSASATHNRWWLDTLENGPSSTFASFFDIDWMPLKPDLADKILLPVLGEQYGKVLESGQLVVCFADGFFWIEYFDQRFPIAPRTYSLILGAGLDELQTRLGADGADLLELLSILTSIRNLPPRNESDAERLAERRREKEVIKRRLHELVQRSPEVAAYVAEQVRRINGHAGDSRTFDRLDALLQDQAYRLAFWRVAVDEINYRRFFDINQLAAVCTENPEVFSETHRLLFELIDEGVVTGLRIDHPDGLYDPTQYLSQLQEHEFLRLCRREWQRLRVPRTADPGLAREEEWQPLKEQLAQIWREAARIPGSPLARTIFIVVEKILARGEELPEDWPIHGTVGYEFLNSVGGLFVDPKGDRPLSSLYARFTGESLDFRELAYECKQLIVEMSMASELNVLGYRLDRISERNRWTRDFTLSSLTRALQEVAAAFSVYRTYIQPDRVLERDVRYIEQAIARAQRRNPAMSESIFEFVRDVLLLRYHENADDEERHSIQRFVGKFQQLTGPVMAKAVEDTAFYRFSRLCSLNEVGGEPARFGVPLSEFHNFNGARRGRHPYSLNATSTHDTKRSEDVRSRISVLSEIPTKWREHVVRWGRWNRRYKSDVDGIEAPTRNAEYLLYQTLIGIWPDVIPHGNDRATLVDRVREYMLKVVREAKVNTSWVSPHQAYEAAMARFVDALFLDERRPFLRELDEFSQRVADHGRWNSLSQLLLKITSPGIPDFYQGAELWNLSLVDPDNRRPVDFATRERILNEMLVDLSEMLGEFRPTTAIDAVDQWLSIVFHGQPIAEANPIHEPLRRWLKSVLDSRRDGRIKLFVTLLGLRLRRRCSDLFASGEYWPIDIEGKFADRIVAFARRASGHVAIVVVPRLTVAVVGFGGPPPVANAWQDTNVILPTELLGRADQQSFVDLFTFRRHRAAPAASNAALPVSEILSDFPVSLLVM